jgi:hypothetical protein
MFIGHFAIGFASKRLAPEANLGWLIAAPLFLDLIWPVFVLAGIEKVQIELGNTAFTPLAFVYYPISHSFVTALGWSVLFGLVYFAVSRHMTEAIVVGSGVLSHWLLDAIVHRPDLPLYPGGEKFIGFGLWNSITGTIIVESLIFIAGIVLYSKVTRPKDKIGLFAFWAFIGILILIYISNILSPPPPSSNAIAYVALLVWIFPIWASWFDFHRDVRRP